VPKTAARRLKINRENTWQFRRIQNERVSGSDISTDSTGQPVASRRAVVTDTGPILTTSAAN
jgi:hypothetical protein